MISLSVYSFAFLKNKLIWSHLTSRTLIFQDCCVRYMAWWKHDTCVLFCVGFFCLKCMKKFKEYQYFTGKCKHSQQPVCKNLTECRGLELDHVGHRSCQTTGPGFACPWGQSFAMCSTSQNPPLRQK